MRLLPPVAAAALALTLIPAPTQAGQPVVEQQTQVAAKHGVSARKATVPRLKITKLRTGLDLVWDVKPFSASKLLFTQRDKATLSTLSGGKVHRVKGFPSHKVWVSGETGLLGLYVDPINHQRIYTCQGWQTRAGGHDVRVIAWHLDKKATRIRKDKVLIKGLPSTSGRHGGCRLLVDGEGSLIVGTGDAATGTNPENVDSLGGKTLRISRRTGEPWPTNRFINSAKDRRYVHTYGHRNVQGLALRADGTVWSMEHGPDRDDEVNFLANGADYGWNPVPGYNEAVPMTDQDLPADQVEARWSSGYPTVATSGGTFVYGSEWGALNGTLAVACLKAGQVMFLKFDKVGKFVKGHIPPRLTKFGRLRTVTQMPNGSLLVATSNGGDADMILRVSPK
jgi:glucose/arabinose dehydrogenase